MHPNDTIQPAAANPLAIRTDPIRRSVAIDCSVALRVFKIRTLLASLFA